MSVEVPWSLPSLLLAFVGNFSLSDSYGDDNRGDDVCWPEDGGIALACSVYAILAI